MLNSFYISNYRILNNFKIEKLSRVNLLTGKNNTGKTTLLEAILLYQNDFSPELIAFILRKRNGMFGASVKEMQKALKYLRNNFSFTNDSIENVEVKAGEYEDPHTFNIVFTSSRNGKGVKINTHKYQKSSPPKMRMMSEGKEVFDLPNNSQNELKWGNVIIIDSYDFGNNEKFNAYWDNIDGTQTEDELISALSIITPIEKFRFVKGESETKRISTVLKKGDIDRTPLRMMGDGMNRLLQIILAMLNCKDGIFLIDEIENGLHYSVMEKMWEVIFHLSEKLNIQVFATTHSNDVIKSFGSLLLNETYAERGQILKLKNDGVKIECVDFNLENIEVAISHDIELR
ncbi:MAG: AAA family ATPase [Chloroherpetonaceae bacterium]|nr:AAA family ATPase [Chloroherpetonaceae bacterium]